MLTRERNLVPGSLPSPAPLPSLTTAFSRRAALFGAVTASGFLAAAGVAALAPPAITPELEPLVTLRRSFVELMAQSRRETDEEAVDTALEAASELHGESFDLRATTPAGALASLEWAREEFGRHYVEEPGEPDWLDRWTLAMIDSALGVLQTQVEAAGALR